MMEGLVDPFTEGSIDVPNMSFATNSVGYDWKSYGGGGFTILDDRCYFIKTVTGAHYRIVFTGFEGTTSGNIELGKVAESGVNTDDMVSQHYECSVYPNPVVLGDVLSIRSEVALTEMHLYGLAGTKILSKRLQGLTIDLPTDILCPGLYVLEVQTKEGERQTFKVTVQ